MQYFSNLKYYYWASFRRKQLDKLLLQHSFLYKGFVLDIGGRQRGLFKGCKNQVKKWVFADINKEYHPDIILDVANMQKIKTKSVDVVNAIELFEHVEEIEKGLNECYRVLKNKGIFILSTPFLYGIHSDPSDYQRWTQDKWKKTLKRTGFKIKKMLIMGLYFTVLCDMFKSLIESLPKPIRMLCSPSILLLSLIIRLDNINLVRKNPKLNKYHSGYFIIAEK